MKHPQRLLKVVSFVVMSKLVHYTNELSTYHKSWPVHSLHVQSMTEKYNRVRDKARAIKVRLGLRLGYRLELGLN